MENCYIVDGVRTPIGKFAGKLSGIRSDDLAAIPVSELIRRNPNLNPAEVDDLILGCANQAGEDNRNIARMAGLLSGLPWSVPGETVNRLCASGLAASINGFHAIRSREADLIIAGGIEHMTRGPWVISKVSSPFGRDAEMHDSSFGWRFINPKMKKIFGVDSMGQTAENLASLYKITREAQDQFALQSQMKAGKAIQSGRFAREIIPVEIQAKKGPIEIFNQDEFPKPDTNIEGLASLKPAFKSIEEGGTVTAGNASGLNDGAAALLLASEAAVLKNKFKPLARIISSGVAGVEPRYMGIGPVPASKIALSRAGLNIEQMDIIELNEAFAAQVLSCLREWNIDAEDPRINPNGGAIALGHPLGMSGARLLLSAALELQIQQKKYALVTMCIGVGQGYACVIERI
ncbi:MAG: acetyl-CoA C-acyltransferase [Saprospiraceae bacterium]|nr:acetyl-CoA C-acyltransferase [Saprospiraceae bacterium]